MINSYILQIHSKDVATLTQITTFLEYTKGYKSPPPGTPPSAEEPETAPLFWTSLRTKPLVQEVQCDLASLYTKSLVTALTFSAFTEGMYVCTYVTV